MTCANGGHLVDLDHRRGDGVARIEPKTFGTEIESGGLSRGHPPCASLRLRREHVAHHPPEPEVTPVANGDSVKVIDPETLPAEAEMGLLMETAHAQRPG